MNSQGGKIRQLYDLVALLRSENGCPWDRKQTPVSMIGYLVEESFELLAAVEAGDAAHVKEELGDVLFHICFIARLFEETGHFTIGDVIQGVCEKMVRRHPHVFDSRTLDTPEQVKQQWHSIKAEEKKEAGSLLDSVPQQLPALMRAYRISERAARVGFDWENLAGVMEKAQEEWQEMRSALLSDTHESPCPARVAEEFGDILFTLANVARFIHVHPETALTGSIRKFVMRFQYMEKKSR